MADFRDRSYASVPEVFFAINGMRSTRRSSTISYRQSIIIQCGQVVANQKLCREHYRLTMVLRAFHPARPGQFVHLSPEVGEPASYRIRTKEVREPPDVWTRESGAPMLRRAFSIAGLRRTDGDAEVDVIYRVVGRATRWMASLAGGDGLSVLGPLGNVFPIVNDRPIAWLVAGGVGLPPMLWLAEALDAAGKSTVAFCGARTADLLPLTLERANLPARDAGRAVLSCREFAQHGTGVVISTDDGSVGYEGHVGAAMTAHHRANPIAPEELVVYTCGPERMMRWVAEYCAARGVLCYVCMERAMACGTGLCQSCVVPVRDEADPEGWRYGLCCSEGPIFEAGRILWEPAASG